VEKVEEEDSSKKDMEKEIAPKVFVSRPKFWNLLQCLVKILVINAMSCILIFCACVVFLG
jgi:hypothetical protein